MNQQTLEQIRTEAVKRMASAHGSQHNLNHVYNVVKSAMQMSQSYDIDKNLLEAICYVHDLTYTEYYPGIATYVFEGKYIASILDKYLDQFNIDSREKGIIINACKRHPHSYPFKVLNRNTDLYTKILQDADTLDMFSDERVDNSVFTKNLKWIPVKRLMRVVRLRYINFFLNIPQ